MKETLRPLGDKIVVRREEPDHASPGGILLPDNAKEKPTRGVVVAIGDGVKQDVLLFNYPAGNEAAERQQRVNADKIMGKLALMCPRSPNGDWSAVEQVQRPSDSIKVGDVVLFSAYAGNSVEIDGQELLIMREDDVLCVVEKSK